MIFLSILIYNICKIPLCMLICFLRWYSLFVHSVSNLVVKKVISANRLLDSPVGITIHRNNREHWAVILKVTGKTIYTVGDKNILSDGLHPVILPKGCTYSWKCIEPGECLIIEFDADEKSEKLISFKVNDSSDIVNAFSKIEKSLNKQNSYYRLECYNQIYSILLFLVKSVSKESTHPQKNKIIYPSIKYITEKYFDGNITNEFLADICGMSTVYFRKIFKSVYGIPPTKYLHNFRIEKAKAILQSDYESIEQVAFSVGYNSIYHFSKMFKLYTGKSPLEYAKASRN